LTSQWQNGAMIESRRPIRGRFNGLWKALHLLGLFNHGCKVAIFNVLHTVHTHFIERVQAILVNLARWQDTVGGNDNGTGKAGKFKLRSMAVVAKNVECEGQERAREREQTHETFCNSRMTHIHISTTYLLILPGRAVVSSQVRKGLELGIAMRRLHFSMRIHIHTGTVCLDEEFMQIGHVVTGNLCTHNCSRKKSDV
jgi:hypothetical protein